MYIISALAPRGPEFCRPISRTGPRRCAPGRVFMGAAPPKFPASTGTPSLAAIGRIGRGHCWRLVARDEPGRPVTARWRSRGGPDVFRPVHRRRAAGRLLPDFYVCRTSLAALDPIALRAVIADLSSFPGASPTGPGLLCATLAGLTRHAREHRRHAELAGGADTSSPCTPTSAGRWPPPWPNSGSATS